MRKHGPIRNGAGKLVNNPNASKRRHKRHEAAKAAKKARRKNR